jgi:superfamily II DNA or RNA helicase
LILWIPDQGSQAFSESLGFANLAVTSLSESFILPGFESFAPAAKFTGDPDGCRDYQREAVTNGGRDLNEVRGVLFNIFPGGGKTHTASVVVKHWPGRVLWLAMRDFLLDQAQGKLQELTGTYVSIEKGRQTATGTRIVLGSVQTLKGKRLAGWPRDSFSLIVFDEAHHAVAPGPRKIFDHFSGAKILGLTGTPQRLDKIGLGNVFQRTSIEKDILWGIENGYLCPVVPIERPIQSIDLSKVKSFAGDLSLSDLEREIIEAAAPIARVTWEESDFGNRPTLVYTPGVESAKAVCRTLNKIAGYDCAASVDQETPPGRRREVLARFGNDIRVIVNCLIYTEGLDVPLAEVIVISRLTKSIALYQQMACRGGRPVTGIGQLPTKEERLAAIKASKKPNFKLVDITGHAGRHTLITAADALAGKDVPPDVVKLAKEIIKSQPGIELDEATKLARQEAARIEREALEAAQRKISEAAAAAKVKSTRGTFDPFRRLGAIDSANGIKPSWLKQRPTADQLLWMKENKLPISDDLSRGDIEKLRRQSKEWRKIGKASFRQRNVLAKAGLPVDIPGSVASRLIGVLVHYKFNAQRARKELDFIVAAGRTPGEDV